MTYALRLLGVRAVLVGADLWLARNKALRHAVSTAPLIHASDVISAAVGGLTGHLPRRVAVTTVGAPTVTTVLAPLALLG